MIRLKSLLQEAVLEKQSIHEQGWEKRSIGGKVKQKKRIQHQDKLREYYPTYEKFKQLVLDNLYWDKPGFGQPNQLPAGTIPGYDNMSPEEKKKARDDYKAKNPGIANKWLYKKTARAGEYVTLTIGDNKRINLTTILPEMQELMNSTSRANFDKLLTDPKNYLYALDAIVYFNKTQRTDKWKNIFVAATQDVEDMKKQVGATSKPAGPKQTLAFPYTFPVSQSPNADFFNDNSANIKPLFKQEVLRWMELSVQDAIAAGIPKSQAKFFVNGIHVSTSCSRIRNTNGDTWAELAQKRAAAADEEFRKILSEDPRRRFRFKAKNSTGQEMVTPPSEIDAIGGNGDGSSGPDPSSSLDGVKEGGFANSPDGKKKTFQNNEDRYKGKDGKMELGQTRAEMEKYKYLIVTAHLTLANTNPVPRAKDPESTPPDKDTAVLPTSTYDIEFYRPNTGIIVPVWSGGGGGGGGKSRGRSGPCNFCRKITHILNSGIIKSMNKSVRSIACWIED